MSYVDYDAWGKPVKKFILKNGQRELDLVTEYTGHPYDQVLGLYFAEARMYDAEDRRFVSVDWVYGRVTQPVTLVPYLHTADNPLKYVDRNGLFLEGTELIQGAEDTYSSTDVALLQGALVRLGYLDPVVLTKYLLGKASFDQETEDALNAYILDHNEKLNRQSIELNRPEIRNDLWEYSKVDSRIWRSLGLSINQTLEEEFWSGRRGNDTLSLTISGNNVTINYSPKMLIVSEVSQSDYYKALACDIFDHKSVHVTNYQYSKMRDRIVQGFKEWEVSHVIQGINTNVTVNVTPTRTYALDYDVLLEINTPGSGGIVLGSAGWNIYNAASIHIWVDAGNAQNINQSSGNDYISAVASHEFGHTLGVMDAYGAWYQPQAPAARATKPGTVMWDSFNAVSALDIELMLYAWSRNRMQGFSAGLLGEDSQAWYR